jgi:tetratricopeptide (TPR) repeat protein
MILLLLAILLTIQAPAQKPSPGAEAFAEANALYEKRENEKALAAYERAIAFDSRNSDYHLGRCRTLARLQRHAEGVLSCTQALRLRPDDPIILRDRGHYYINLRQFEDALADLTRAEQLKKDDGDVYYHLGLTHYLLGNWNEAAAAYVNCLRLAKEDDEIVACSTWLYPSLRRAGRDADAQKVLDRISPDMEVKENTAYVDRLLLFKGVKKESEVSPTMNTDPLSVPTVGYGLGLWHLLSGRTKEARGYFEKATSGEFRTAFGFIASEVELKRMSQPAAK